MGVPSFFRWLAKKYPKTVTDVAEPPMIDLHTGERIEIDLTKSNPNGFEIDCLYLDMNGIIHPCTHNDQGESPPTEDAMMHAIFEYIDRLFSLARPRSLIYMAIDGVAPRAKMNQQRSRRFRAAKEMREKEEIEEKVRKEWRDLGRIEPPKRSRPWDSNVITPGTPFMHKLSQALHYYIADRLNSRSAWKGLKVIFSDANVPGEGEHKIMNFMRLQRAQPGYNANQTHCLYGMDADLIMLGLAMHEPYFKILRETVTLTNPTPKCDICKGDHYTSDCTGEFDPEKVDGTEIADKSNNNCNNKDHNGSEMEMESKAVKLKPFQFIHINVLREYLAYDLFISPHIMPFAWDLERVIDDFVFLCFFVGNDFLPHLPSLEIREGAIERLCGIYKRLLPSLGGYIADGAKINLARADVLISELGSMEDNILRQRKYREERQAGREKQRSEKSSAARAKFNANVKAHAEMAGMKAVTGSVAKRYMENAQNLGKAKRRRLDDGVEIIEENTDINQARPTIEILDSSDKPAKKSKKLTTNVEIIPDSVIVLRPTEEIVIRDETADEPEAKYELNTELKTEIDLSVEEEISELQRSCSSSSLSSISSVSSIDDDHEPPKTPPVDAKSPAPVVPEVAPLEKIENFADLLNARLQVLTDPQQTHDNIRFGEDGWKDRYYQVKMNVNVNSEDPQERAMLDSLFRTYIEGLCWVMAYYYEGCASWSWYYPFHYAPMASDLRNIDRYTIQFDKSKPFAPVAQLMGVLPARSCHCLPMECQELMLNPDSPIADFYPEDFPLDLNGKRYLWQAVALLPWIDEKRLLDTVEKITITFTPEERQRNSLGNDYLFVRNSNILANELTDLYMRFGHLLSSMNKEEKLRTRHRIESENLGDTSLFGYIEPYSGAITPGSSMNSTIGLEKLKKLAVVSAIYLDIDYKPHLCKLLPGAVVAPAILTELDFQESSRGGHGPRFGEKASFIRTVEMQSLQQEQSVMRPNKHASYPDVPGSNSNDYHHRTPYSSDSFPRNDGSTRYRSPDRYDNQQPQYPGSYYPNDHPAPYSSSYPRGDYYSSHPTPTYLPYPSPFGAPPSQYDPRQQYSSPYPNQYPYQSQGGPYYTPSMPGAPWASHVQHPSFPPGNNFQTPYYNNPYQPQPYPYYPPQPQPGPSYTSHPAYLPTPPQAQPRPQPHTHSRHGPTPNPSRVPAPPSNHQARNQNAPSLPVQPPSQQTSQPFTHKRSSQPPAAPTSSGPTKRSLPPGTGAAPSFDLQTKNRFSSLFVDKRKGKM